MRKWDSRTTVLALLVFVVVAAAVGYTLGATGVSEGVAFGVCAAIVITGIVVILPRTLRGNEGMPKDDGRRE